MLGRSVYVLVLAADKVPGTKVVDPHAWDETGNNLPYWLKMLHHHAGPDAPVVIAITRCDTDGGKRPQGQRPVDQPVELVVRDVGRPFQAVPGEPGGVSPRTDRRAAAKNPGPDCTRLADAEEGRAGLPILRAGRADGPVLRTIVATQLRPEEFRPFGVNVVAVVDGLSATKGKNAAEKQRLLAANQQLEEAITAALKVIEKPLSAAVPPKIVTLIQAVEPELRPLPYLNFTHFQKLCQKCEIGSEDDLPGVLNSLQQSSLRILDGLGVLFFFGKTDHEQQMLAAKNKDYWTRMAPGRERFERLQPGSLLKQTLLNPRWIKKAAYEIAEASTRHVEFQEQAFKEYVQRAHELVTGKASTSVHPNDLLLVQEFMKLSGLCWEVDGTFHFPRGYMANELQRIDDWPLTTLRWGFLPESAFFQFVVDMRSNPLYDLTGIEQWRHAVKVDLEGITLAVTARVASDTLEIRFDPKSDRREWRERMRMICQDFTRFTGAKPLGEWCEWSENESANPDGTGDGKPPTAPRQSTVGRKKPSTSNLQRDAKITEAWKRSGDKSYEDFARKCGRDLGLNSADAVESAVERHRKRRKK